MPINGLILENDDRKFWLLISLIFIDCHWFLSIIINMFYLVLFISGLTTLTPKLITVINSPFTGICSPLICFSRKVSLTFMLNLQAWYPLMTHSSASVVFPSDILNSDKSLVKSHASIWGRYLLKAENVKDKVNPTSWRWYDGDPSRYAAKNRCSQWKSMVIKRQSM